MRDILKDAEFGDKFRTKSGEIAIYFKYTDFGNFPHSLIVGGKDPLKVSYTQDGFSDYMDESFDIVSRYEDWELWREAHFEFERLGAMYSYSDCDIVWRKVEENIRNKVNISPRPVQIFNKIKEEENG